MEGIFLDTIRRSDAIIEFKKNYPVIENFEEMDGFLIYHSNEHFFGSQWKELPIIIRSFKPLEIPDAKPEIVETIEKTEETKETEEIEEITREEIIEEITEETLEETIELEDKDLKDLKKIINLS